MQNLNIKLLIITSLLLFSLKSIAEVEPTSGRYFKEVTDLNIKVAGGMVKWKRLYEEGRWKFNESWSSLVFEIDSADSSILRIVRGGDEYEKLDSAGTIYKFGPRLMIRKNSDETGWKWTDREGNFMNYNLSGLPISMGHIGGYSISFIYQEGRLVGVDSANGIRVLNIGYVGLTNYVDSITDHSGREVLYHWSDINGNPVRKKLDRVTDVNGHDWVYGYRSHVNDDGYVDINQLTDPENRVIDIFYGSAGRVNKIKDPMGQFTHYTFDYIKARKEYYIKTKYPGGQIKEMWYERDGDLKRKDVNGVGVTSFREDLRKEFVTDIYGRTTTREFDEFRNLIKVTYADGAYESQTFDVNTSNVLLHTNERGIRTQFTYENGKLTNKIEAADTDVERVTEYTYDLYGQLKTIKKLGDDNTEETTREYFYDGFGNVIKINDEESNEIFNFDHNATGKPLRVVDGNGHETQFTYDASGVMTSTISPELNEVKFVFDKVGNLVELINADDSKVKYEYDDLDRLIKETDELNFVQTYEYDVDGNLTKFVDRDGKHIVIEYDSANRAVAQKDALNNRIELMYQDDQGNYLRSPTKIVFPTFTISYEYDSRGRLVQENYSYFEGQDEIIETVRYSFDSVGNLTSVVSDTDATRNTEYDALDRVIKTTVEGASQMKFKYDDRNNLISVIDALNNEYRFSYNKLNKRISEITPAMEAESHLYNANGDRIEYTDLKGQKSTYEYNKDNLLEIVKYYDVNENLEKTVEFSYDERGNLVSYNDGITQGEFEYDLKNQKIREKITYGTEVFEHRYSYFPSGRKASYTDVEGIQYQFHYNELGDLNNLVIPNEGNIKFENFLFHKPQTVKYPNEIERTNSFDALFNLKGFEVKKSQNHVLIDRQYDFFPNGMISQISTELEAGTGEYKYQYDDFLRLTTAEYPSLTDDSFTYDLMGNRKTDENTGSNEWSYNQLSQLEDSVNFHYEYDLNGNLIALKDTNDQIIQTYHFNSQNKMSEVRNELGQLVASYYHDPFGRRLSKTVFDENQMSQTTYFHYSDEGYAAEKNESGLTTYLFLPDSPWSAGPVFSKIGTSYYYYQNDHIGTPQIVHDNQGNILNSKEMNAFGSWQNQVNLIEDNFGFAGQYRDSETGFYYNLLRYYDPKTGRYISRDPIKFNGGMNMYLYANSSPTKYVDPLGLKVIGKWHPEPELTNFDFSCHSGLDCADFGTGFDWMFAVNLKIEATAEIQVGVKCEDTCTKEKWEANLRPFTLDASYSSQFELPFWCGLIAKGLKKMGAKTIHTASATAACWAALVTNLYNAYPKVKNAVENVLNNKAIPIIATLLEHGPETVCIQYRD